MKSDKETTFDFGSAALEYLKNFNKIEKVEKRVDAYFKYICGLIENYIDRNMDSYNEKLGDSKYRKWRFKKDEDNTRIEENYVAMKLIRDNNDTFLTYYFEINVLNTIFSYNGFDKDFFNPNMDGYNFFVSIFPEWKVFSQNHKRTSLTSRQKISIPKNKIEEQEPWTYFIKEDEECFLGAIVKIDEKITLEKIQNKIDECIEIEADPESIADWELFYEMP